MNGCVEPTVRRNADGLFAVWSPSDGELVCTSAEDAALVLDAVLRKYEGDTGRKLPRETLGALERAGQNTGNSLIYRSALGNLAEE